MLNVFTRHFFGLNLKTADEINSDFRLADALDSFGGLVGVNEAQSLKWDRFSPHLQAAAEQPRQPKHSAIFFQGGFRLLWEFLLNQNKSSTNQVYCGRI